MIAARVPGEPSASTYNNLSIHCFSASGIFVPLKDASETPDGTEVLGSFAVSSLSFAGVAPPPSAGSESHIRNPSSTASVCVFPRSIHASFTRLRSSASIFTLVGASPLLSFFPTGSITSALRSEKLLTLHHYVVQYLAESSTELWHAEK